MIKIKNKYNSVEEMVLSLIDDKSEAKKINNNLKKRKVIDFLISLRVEAKVSQVEFAKRLGVSQSAISKLEHSNDDKITLYNIIMYADLIDKNLQIRFLSKNRCI